MNACCRVTQVPYITGARMALKEVKGLSGTQVADTTFYLGHTTNPQSVRTSVIYVSTCYRCYFQQHRFKK